MSPGMPVTTGGPWTVAGTVLVVGSYPPSTTPGAAVTLAVVRQLIAGGATPVVSSPRTSAAEFDVPVAGIFAGRRLRRLAGLAGARHLVVCVEPDLPVLTNAVVPPLLGIVQRRTVDGIVAAAGSFDTFTLVLGADAGIPPLLLGRLRAAAGEVRTVATAEVGDAAVPATGVTVLGPDAATPAARALTITGRLGRRALAPLPAPVRNAGLAAARTGVHALRAVRDR